MNYNLMVLSVVCCLFLVVLIINQMLLLVVLMFNPMLLMFVGCTEDQSNALLVVQCLLY
jgi:hypothetical protein